MTKNVFEKDVFEKAIEVLNEFGHIKGRSGDQDAGYCSIGALNHAYVELTEAPSVYYRPGLWLKMTGQLARYVPNYNDGPRSMAAAIAVAEYNDLPSTTIEDIILMFKKAAADDQAKCDNDEEVLD